MSSSNRDREEAPLTFTIPSSSSNSSPITVSDQLDSYLADPRSASGSFQNEGLLVGGESGRRSYSSAKLSFNFKCLLDETRLTICEGHDGTETSNGDVLIFPDMIRYRYGYVTPDDVPSLLQQHIVKGEIIDSLWRGQMGLSEDEQIKSQEQRFLLNGLGSFEEGNAMYRSHDNSVGCCQTNGVSCCQENGVSSSSQNHVLVEKRKNADVIETEAKLSADNKSGETVISRIKSGKGASRKFHSMTTWLESWEREDTYAALAVVCAAVSVGIAYNCYKQLT
ncbi:hypothetical protein Ahy_B07g088836 isoform A [Arachis hypogaea]|uniref:Uncharacterized protein n=1 Tax=Arachis hypogaea TaxID=3818 RepID=A0A444YFL0_ARAHY|nr:hypothetical protein Ahy_B07g088836 isoform A [Arachis hypogaea]